MIDTHRQRIIRLANAQRWLLVVFVVYFLAAFVYRMFTASTPMGGATVLLVIAVWVVMLAMVAAVARLLSNVWWMLLVIVLMLVPLVNLFTLLAVNARAVKRLKEAGLTVGLLGVPREQLR